jgi:hypothetical protein
LKHDINIEGNPFVFWVDLLEGSQVSYNVLEAYKVGRFTAAFVSMPLMGMGGCRGEAYLVFLLSRSVLHEFEASLGYIARSCLKKKPPGV